MDIYSQTGAREKPVALIADDDKDTRFFITKALELYGFEVVPATNGMEAFKLFKQTQPNIVITDIYMPFLNGVVLLNKIKEISVRKPVILITGYSHYRQLIESSRFPPDGFIEKPFSIEKLYKTISSVIGKINNIR